MEAKIIGFKADGVRKLNVVELKFAENGLTKILGKNRHGKSTIIDAIEWLIKGQKVLDRSAKNPKKEKATGELILGDYLIKRVMTDKTVQLAVKNIRTNETVTGEVQNFLNTFINELTFNPRALANLTRVEKYQFCMKLYNIDFTELNKQLLSLEEERLLTGREVKRFGEIAPVPEVEEINVNELLQQKKKIDLENLSRRNGFELDKLKEIEEINLFNKIQRTKKDDINAANNTIEKYSIECNNLETEIFLLQEELEKKQKQKIIAEEKIDAIRIASKNLPQPEPEKPLTTSIPEPEYISTSELDSSIQGALKQNKEAEIFSAYKKKVAEKQEKQLEYDLYDGKIRNIREEKIRILRSIDTKVEGLSIGEDDIYYNEIGSDNWSDSERLRITSELCLAMMPKLKAIFIDGAEEMDKDNLKDLHEWAVAHNIQIICTIVANEKEEGENCFYICEGEIQ